MTDEDPNNLNRIYLDKRGIPVRVVRYDREKKRVIYLRDGYEHECFAPLYKFKDEFTRVME
ncbi:TPA: DUF4222 domain-containing protein [Providencia alcalifaciens]|uniref:DUF4222 domain-containing protein n=1 Tax=Providencia TaxID=586 RepID=UPI00044596CB|nr:MULTISPECIES: DUF4222 domain-containing protein [Providencia]EUC94310.1 PF13973 domain protein [Providencia alcalifaciens PAL-2]MTB31208.1 DUF4222 domain-containing protein [Providencia alcalifaciens]MTC97108.1 DUF4222 domain-containing protein [Providencia alcalifaciens]